MRSIRVKKFLKTLSLTLGVASLMVVVPVKCKLAQGDSMESKEQFSLDNINLKQFLGMITGVIKIGNHTINLPQDLPKLIRGSEPPHGYSSEKSLNKKYGELARYMKHGPGGGRSHRIEDRHDNYKITFHPERKDGWGVWENENGWGWENEKKRESGLISLGNFFRLGCVIFDIAEIKKSAQNGLF